MPYYCTVPRCTSMAGKAKNVSFHQFPRDEELAGLWNEILKRGKPYTKYSKVCSLHFTPDDYTITSVGKNKGQWRTLRKDAVPSQNLPPDSPSPHLRSRSSGSWCSSSVPSLMDPIIQQQMAQAIYMQTMMAMQAAGTSEDAQPQNIDNLIPNTSTPTLGEIEQFLLKHSQLSTIQNNADSNTETSDKKRHFQDTFKCEECSKCFKDPDVFVLHQRGHKKKDSAIDNVNEKENFDSNSQESLRQSTLHSNPILANLLRQENNDTSNTTPVSVENQIIAALAANMEAYIKNFTSLITQQKDVDLERDNHTSDEEAAENGMVEIRNAVENDSNTSNSEGKVVETNCTLEIEKVDFSESVETSSNVVENLEKYEGNQDTACDIQDLTITKDSNNLALTV